MKVTFVNNAGAGVSQTHQVPSTKTVGQLFADQMNGANAQNYSISILRGSNALTSVALSTVLQDGDIVSVVSNKTAANAYHMAHIAA